MPAIIWDESMSTGVQALDDQHKQVITWLNEMLEAMLQGKGHAEIKGMLDRINSYTTIHFRHEEDCMARYKCPAAHADAADHARLSRVLAGLNAEFERDGATARRLSWPSGSKPKACACSSATSGPSTHDSIRASRRSERRSDGLVHGRGGSGQRLDEMRTSHEVARLASRRIGAGSGPCHPAPVLPTSVAKRLDRREGGTAHPVP